MLCVEISLPSTAPAANIEPSGTILAPGNHTSSTVETAFARVLSETSDSLADDASVQLTFEVDYDFEAFVPQQWTSGVQAAPRLFQPALHISFEASPLCVEELEMDESIEDLDEASVVMAAAVTTAPTGVETEGPQAPPSAAASSERLSLNAKAAAPELEPVKPQPLPHEAFALRVEHEGVAQPSVVLPRFSDHMSESAPAEIEGLKETDDTREDLLTPAAQSTTSNGEIKRSHEIKPVSRVREVDQPEVQQPDTVRQLSVDLGDTDSGKLHVRFSERAGELRAWVTTGSENAAQQIRTELGDLSRELHNAGFASEVWTPEGVKANVAATDLQWEDGRGGSERESGSDAGGQQQDNRDPEAQEELDVFRQYISANT